MDLMLLGRGVLFGFSIAAPVGPIGLLVIRRTLAEGRLSGLATGLGAATADALYGLVSALGLTLVSAVLLGGRGWLQIVGGLFLCYLGVRTLLAPPAEHAATVDRGSYWRSYISTVLLTLTNPSTILTSLALFAGLKLGEDAGTGALVAVVGGVFLGSAAWWLLLSGGVGLLRSRVTPGVLRWVNRFSGALIVGFGIAALAGLL